MNTNRGGAAGQLATIKPQEMTPLGGMYEQATALVKSGFLPPSIKTAEQAIAIMERLLTRYEIAADGCWLYSGTIDPQGYGRVAIPGDRNVLAHRLMSAITHGPLPRDAKVLHRCDTPRCVNPEHLMRGTQAENMHDMRRKGRASKGLGRYNAKLTDITVRAIRRGASLGVSQSVLSKGFGISQSVISGVVSGRRWSHVN